MITLEKHKIWVLMILVGMLFLSTRTIFLESDTPPLSETLLFPEDEFFYTTGGFNLYHHGDILYQHQPYLKPDASLISSPMNIFASYAGLSVLGNNYYALRMPAVIASCFAFLFILLLIQKTITLERSPPALLLLPALYLALNFSFIMSARVFEPTIFRMSWMLLCLWLLVTLVPEKKTPSPTVSFSLGLLSCISFLFIYPSNLFVTAGTGFAILTLSLSGGWKSTIRNCLMCLMGISLGAGLFYFYLISIYDGAILDGILSSISPYKSRANIGENAQNGTFILKTISNILATMGANVFRFNTGLFIIFMVTVPLYASHVIRERKNIDLVIASFMLLFSIQCLFINDFPSRKQIMMLPFLLLILIRVIQKHEDIRLWVLSSDRRKKFARGYFYFVLLLSVINMLSAYGIKLWSTDADQIRPYVIGTSNIILAYLSINIVLSWYRKHDIKLLKLAKIGLLFSFLPELFLSGHFIFANPSFLRKNAMIEVASIIDGKNVVGCESIGMRLYNKSNVYLNLFRYQLSDNDADKLHESEYGNAVRQLISENKIDYSFCRIDENRLSMSAMGFELVRTYNTSTDSSRIMGLYKPTQAKTNP